MGNMNINHQEIMRAYLTQYEERPQKGYVFVHEGMIYKNVTPTTWELVGPENYSPDGSPDVELQLDNDVVVSGSQEQVLFSMLRSFTDLPEERAADFTSYLFKFFRTCGWSPEEEEEVGEPVPAFVVSVDGQENHESFPCEDARHLLASLKDPSWNGFATYRTKGSLHVVNCSKLKRLEVRIHPDAGGTQNGE